MRPLRLAAFLVAAGLGACSSATPAQSLCETTIAMADEVASDGEPSRASIDAFVAAAPNVRDAQLRDAAARAATAMRADPASAIDPLAAVYDRCIELDHAEDAPS